MKAATFLIVSLFMPLTSPAQNQLKLKAQIFKMPEAVELSSVTTAGHYILASHLVRSLTKLDQFGKIQGDIAVRWEPSTDRKVWTLHIGSAKFSDGSLITADDVVASVEKQRKLGAGVHFPFGEIQSVKAVGATSLVVTLKNARNDFVYDLSKPEFGVLAKADRSKAKNECSYAVSSGAYFLERRAGSAYHLKANPYFPGAKNKLDLVMESSDGDTSPKALAKGEISFLTTQQNLSAQLHKEVAALPELQAVKPHVAFSYWISLNPLSPYFKVSANRAYVQTLVHSFRSKEMNGHSWEKADQLYLPDGDGRPTKESLAAAWGKIEKNAVPPVGKPKLRVVPLKMTNTLIAELLDFLGEKFDVELVNYNSEEELVALLKGEKFDLKISSNDFSSVDLSENLKTTFNSSRPYIFVGQNKEIPSLLKQAIQTEDKAVQSKLFQKIGLEVLDDGLIAPLAYQRIWFYLSRQMDISAWSSIYPEISFWKVSVHD